MSKAPSKKERSDVKANTNQSKWREAADSKATYDCARSAPYKYMKNQELAEESALQSASMYADIDPRTTKESMLASLTVAVYNAAQDCFAQASSLPQEYLHHRNVNLRMGLKAATAVPKLMEALDRLRGERNSVNVRDVNVEAGGQAIVGNVHNRDVDDGGS